MKKITLLIAAVLMTAIVWSVEPTWTRVWENSATLSSLPAYIGTTNNVRGMGVGTFEGEKVVVIPTREGGTAVKVLKASDGTEWKNLDVTGVSGGLFAVSDAGVTDDGKILVSNMSNSNNNPSHPFKVYMWSNSTSAPTVAISYVLPGAYRFGDHITVKGRIDDGTAKVYAVSGNVVDTKVAILRFDMIPDGNGGFVFNQTPVNLTPSSITATGGYPSIDFLPDGSFINKYNGSNMMKYASDGTFITGQSSSSAIIATGGNSVRFLMSRHAVNGGEPDTAYIAYFRYGAGQERANIVKFPNAALNSSAAAISVYLPVLGTNGNANGAGRVAFDDLATNSLNIYVLSTNNGIGKYTITWPPIVYTAMTDIKESVKIIHNSTNLKVEGNTPEFIELYNMMGQKVQSVINGSELNISNLHGVHIIKINVNGEISTQKVSL